MRGVLVMVGVHLHFASAAEVGFHWDPLVLGWSRPGLPLLSSLAGPSQHFRSAILDAWRGEVAADLCDRGFSRVVLFWIFMVPCRCLTLTMLEKGIRLCSGVSWLVVFGMVTFLGRVRGQSVPCRFCGAPVKDRYFFLGMHLSSSC